MQVIECSSSADSHVLQLAAMAGGAPPAGERYSGTTFSVVEEDHTLANSLRFFLNKKCAIL